VIHRISKATAADCYRKWHYLGRCGFLHSYSFGAYFNGFILGAITYSTPGAQKIAALYDDHRGVFELTRLALSPKCPKNSESRCIAITLRMLRKLELVKMVITYADTLQGHVGTIYKASGFEYIGLTAKKKDFFVNGKKLGRGFYKDPNGEWIERSQKHLYVKRF
jgi:hypothetical protein